MAVLESYKIVSEGWNHDSFGRDLAAVLGVVAAYIGGDAELMAAAEQLHVDGKAALAGISQLAKKWPLPVSTEGFDGEVRTYRGKTRPPRVEPHSFGMYSWDEAARLVTVTELPMGVLTANYLEKLLKPGRNGAANPRAGYIEGVEDYSTDVKVELRITLREGAFEEIRAEYGADELDPIEDFLMLHGSLRPHLNYYDIRGGVLEFGDTDVGYLAALLYWAKLRRDLYVERLTRERILAELRILEEEQILKYIYLAPDLNLMAIPDEDAAAEVLRKEGFLPLHTSLLHRPEYTPNASLRALVTEGAGASYDYLLNLRERDQVSSAITRREKRLEELRKELAGIESQLAEAPVVGASVWLAELENFKRVVVRGVETSWKFK